MISPIPVMVFLVFAGQSILFVEGIVKCSGWESDTKDNFT